MLWEATVGRRLWHGMNEPEIMHALLTGQVPLPHDAKPNVNPELDRIVRRAMAVHPEHRYQTAVEMAEDLDEWLARCGVATGPRDVGRAVVDAFVREPQRWGASSRRSSASSARHRRRQTCRCRISRA